MTLLNGLKTAKGVAGELVEIFFGESIEESFIDDENLVDVYSEICLVKEEIELNGNLSRSSIKNLSNKLFRYQTQKLKSDNKTKVSPA